MAGCSKFPLPPMLHSRGWRAALCWGLAAGLGHTTGFHHWNVRGRDGNRLSSRLVRGSVPPSSLLPFSLLVSDDDKAAGVGSVTRWKEPKSRNQHVQDRGHSRQRGLHGSISRPSLRWCPLSWPLRFPAYRWSVCPIALANEMRQKWWCASSKPAS